MGILRLNVRITLCILYLINVVLSQEETVLTCSSTTQETVLNNLRQVFKYPESGPYQQGVSCRWLFSAPETDLKIRYRFTTINVDCGDVLNAYDGDSETDPKLSIDPVCGDGSSIPGVTTTQKNLFIDFFPDSTDNSNELGFTLEVIAGKDLSVCSVTGTTKPISLADAYVLTSPKFPDDYPDDWTCTYTFTAENGVDQIQFDMVYIDLEDETECFDSVKLYDGDSTSSTVLAELCGTSPSVQSFTSTGPSLTVHFESDERATTPQAGFYANVFTLGEETTTTTTLTTTTETEEEEEVTTNTNPEVTEGETGCNRTFFSFWSLCCNLARLCNNWWTFCKTMTQCCKYCGLSSSSLSN
ncbi:CUB and zona pellucida-like domain-containing protein 1 isoform X1 [Magallana gigas]|uniref:CUB and zona pellucida-like domain-containing protein 1 isoform X1 n=1 Tax=Magallana gigas TaxID=29159 RepID=UPI00333EBABF